jgi:hypothetical protein
VEREGRFVGFMCVLFFVLFLPTFLLLLHLRLHSIPFAHTAASCSGSTTNGAPSRSSAQKTSERRVSAGREGAWDKHHQLAEELVGIVEAREGRKERYKTRRGESTSASGRGAEVE